MKIDKSTSALIRSPKAQPLIKWPGGKRALAQTILQFVPATFGTYYEPFFGGGAIYFALQPADAILSDTNVELINAYIQVRDNPVNLAKALRALKNTEFDYYQVRASKPRTEIRKAARMIYLTRLSFNGIHRVNLRGEFNVPYGHKIHLQTINEEQLYTITHVLRHAEFRVGDFEEITESAGQGDVAYFDPPYTVAHANNGFVKYNERIFSWEDQQRLANHSRRLANRGCRVIVSNADHPSIHKLYKGFHCHLIERPSVIAASSIHRRQITECVFILG